MLNEPTLEQLRGLKLNALVAAWQEQTQQASMQTLGFDERFALLVDAEWRQRENQRLVRVLKEAKLKLSQACIEDIDYSARRERPRRHPTARHLHLGPRAPQRPDHRGHRCRQNIRCLRARAASVPAWVQGPVPPCLSALR